MGLRAERSIRITRDVDVSRASPGELAPADWEFGAGDLDGVVGGKVERAANGLGDAIVISALLDGLG